MSNEIISGFVIDLIKTILNSETATKIKENTYNVGFNWEFKYTVEDMFKHTSKTAYYEFTQKNTSNFYLIFLIIVGLK